MIFEHQHLRQKKINISLHLFHHWEYVLSYKRSLDIVRNQTSNN